MPDRAKLKSTLPPDLHDDVEAAYSTTDAPDPRDVVAELHRKGLLDAGQLKDAVVTLEGELKIRHVARRPPASVGQPEILGRLGAGAMGEVLIAKDPGLNRVVAVKRILPEAAKKGAVIRRFYTEAQITAQLDHPGIVPIHGLVQDDEGGLAYAMKLVRGHTLEDFLEEAIDGDDPHHELSGRLERFLHVCDAMSYAHERGIVHRDLKPENIMVGAFGEVMVMDWGIAKILAHRDDPIAEAEQGTSPNIKGTRIGQVMGTPRYMSPEQATGRNDILSTPSDQYALGLILQEVVTLESALPDDVELAEVLGWAQQGRRKPMRADRALIGIVDKACAVSPDGRYASVADFAEDIRRYLRDEAPLAAPDGIAGRMQRWIGRHRRTALTMIMGLFALLVAAGGGLLSLSGGALAFQQYRSQQREARLTEAMHQAMDKAANLDNRLHDIEALTTGVAYAAEAAMEAPTPRVPYQVLKAKPPGGKNAGRYGQNITVDYASVGANKGKRPDTSDLTRLAALGPVMTQAMVASARGDAKRLSSDARHKHLADKRTPVAWSRIGTWKGIVAEAPGTIAYRDDLPPNQKQLWFRQPKTTRGPGWSGPIRDPNGVGQVVTCSVPWYGDTGMIVGVAAMDVTVEWLAAELEPPKGADGAWLLDKDGKAVAWSGMDHKGDPTQPALPHPEHADKVELGKSGWNQSGGSLAIWSPLNTTGYTYVVIGPESVLAGE